MSKLNISIDAFVFFLKYYNNKVDSSVVGGHGSN
jgi:hypothetical protein